jgi:general secretion pathway protein D
LIVLANADGHKEITELIAKLDVDIEPGGEIHVVYLEHAKAEEVAQVLQELSQEAGQNNRNSRRSTTPSRTTNSRTDRLSRARGEAEGADGASKSATAAFDSGMRIAADENTNSLVIIADDEDFQVVKKVIAQLDIERKQVFVDAVILELSSEDSFDFGVAAHLPTAPTGEAAGFIGGQFGTQSLGFSLSQDVLSGLAVGVFGQSIDVPTVDPTGAATSIAVPAFGIALNALKTNSAVNIISNPNILTLDNEEAKIVVGRKVPFPTTAGLNNLGQPVVSFQREDVAITLQITPRVNSANFVTLEMKLEVAEIEEDDQGLNIQQSGPITSKREVETVALVGDNQTVVIGGLVGATDTEVETKFPVLGDLPVVGALFRGRRTGSRKTNLLIFLTPHIIDDLDEDMWEVQKVKEAQRQEFLRRFYGKSRDEYVAEMRSIMQYSMNFVDQPSMFRGPNAVRSDVTIDGSEVSAETRETIVQALEDADDFGEPGFDAGTLPEETDGLEIDMDLDDEFGEMPEGTGTAPGSTEEGSE